MGKDNVKLVDSPERVEEHLKRVGRHKFAYQQLKSSNKLYKNRNYTHVQMYNEMGTAIFFQNILHAR